MQEHRVQLQHTIPWDAGLGRIELACNFVYMY